MADDIPPPVEETKVNITPVKEELVITQEILDRYHEREHIKNVIISKVIPNANMALCRYIIDNLLTNNPIYLDTVLHKNHYLLRSLKKKTEEVVEGKQTHIKLKNDVYLSLREEIVKYIEDAEKELIPVSFATDDEEEPEKFTRNGKLCYQVTNKMTKYKLFKIFCDEVGDCCFQYNFDQPDLTHTDLEARNELQLVKIQITTSPYPFGMFAKVGYTCTDRNSTDPDNICDSPEKITKYYYEVMGSKERIDCPGFKYTTNEEGTRRRKHCNKPLMPVEILSIIREAFYYDINYKNKKDITQSASAFAYEQFEPGYYEAVMFCHTGNFKTPYYQIVDIKPIKPNEFILPQKVPGENYIFTLQKAIDKFVKIQSRDEIAGLLPIKCAMLLQKLATELDFSLTYGIHLVGDASVGKSWLLRRWGFMLNSNFHMTTNGLSISVPALRGSKSKINIMNKEVEINKVGYLGTYKSIHIDEAGENEELSQNLKTFLMESNYSNNKANADGIQHKRTAHINLSQNPSHEHLGAYRGGIKKAYTNMSPQDTVGYDPWDDNWDLMQPLHSYNNIYLKECIQRARDRLRQEKVWWMDGLDIALHDRFPFYFYMIDDKNEALRTTIKENARQDIIDDNIDLVRVLRNDTLDAFFKSLAQYNVEVDVSVFDKVDEILLKNELDLNSRGRKIFYNVIRFSMMLNQRKHVTEEDYFFLEYILSKINRSITLTQLNDYVITPIDKVEIKQPDNLNNKKFTLPENDNGNIEDDFK